METDRIKSQINLIDSYDFISISDYNEDFFCSDKLIVSNLEYSLWNDYKHNYQRIILFEAKEKVYFFDKKSLGLSLNNQSEKKLVNGPLGNFNAIESNNINLSIFSAIFSEYNNKPTEIILNSLESMVIENIPSLYIFRNPNSLLFKAYNNSPEIYSKNFFNNKSFIRLLKRTLNIRNNKNKFIFIFSENIENTKEKFVYEIFPEIHLSEKYFCFGKINYPEKNEIKNLLNHFRLINNLEYSWEKFELYIEKIYQLKLSLKEIYFKLNKIKNLDSIFIIENSENKNLKVESESFKWLEL